MSADLGEGGPPAEEGAPAWMATFGDMMSLLLTFFVLLLSFANMDVVKFKEMMGSVQDAFGVQREHPGDFEGLTTSVIELSKNESTPYIDVNDAAGRQTRMDQEVHSALSELLGDADLRGVVELDQDERGVILRIPGKLLFTSGSADLRSESAVVLDRIAELTQTFVHQLSIEGHTDDLPFSSALLPSNWHLSAARAIAALRYLSEVGSVDPKKLSATGFADMRPLVPNDSRGHRARNRRIEFLYSVPRAQR